MRSEKSVVVSPMGLEYSGLAITAERYSDALRSKFATTRSVVVTGRAEPEHSGSDAVRSFEELNHYIRASGTAVPILWIGLHTSDPLYLRQLDLMALLAEDGYLNVVLPERTQLEDPQSYVAFREALDAGVVSGLMFLNDHHAANWNNAGVPSRVCRPPVPSRFFEAGRTRAHSGSSGIRRHAHMVFVGRMTRRKGVDRIPQLWKRWRSAAAQSGWELTMSLHGQEFLEPGHIDIELLLEMGDGLVKWSPNFPAASEMTGWPPLTLGYTLSRQEFDGIAVSELLACGIPVLASDTTGHRALAEESKAVLLHCTEDAYVQTFLACLADPGAFVELGRNGAQDMLRLRSTGLVGAEIVALIRAV